MILIHDYISASLDSVNSSYFNEFTQTALCCSRHPVIKEMFSPWIFQDKIHSMLHWPSIGLANFILNIFVTSWIDPFNKIVNVNIIKIEAFLKYLQKFVLISHLLLSHYFSWWRSHGMEGNFNANLFWIDQSECG